MTTTYTITAAQRDSLLASRLQHLDRGDGGAAKALDWALALQPAARASEREPLTDEQCDKVIRDALNAMADEYEIEPSDLNLNTHKHPFWGRALVRAGAALHSTGKPDQDDIGRRLYAAEGQVSRLTAELASARGCINEWVEYGGKITDALGLKVMSPKAHIQEIARLRAVTADAPVADSAAPTDEQCDALIEQHVALMPAVDSLRFRGAVTLGELRALVRAARPTAAVAGSAVSSMPDPVGAATWAAARAEANQSPQDFVRGAQWEARRAAARPPAPEEAKNAMTEDSFPVLCKAWGETDLPAALIAYTRADVRKFMVDQWLGEDGEEADARMADFDDPAEWEDLGNEIVWRFEIGGISFSRCYEADRAALSQGGGA